MFEPKFCSLNSWIFCEWVIHVLSVLTHNVLNDLEKCGSD